MLASLVPSPYLEPTLNKPFFLSFCEAALGNGETKFVMKASEMEYNNNLCSVSYLSTVLSSVFLLHPIEMKDKMHAMHLCERLFVLRSETKMGGEMVFLLY